MRTQRPRAGRMSGNRRQPSRRGQVGLGPRSPLEAGCLELLECMPLALWRISSALGTGASSVL